MGTVVGHILHREFFDNISIYFENMAESRHEYLEIMASTARLLRRCVHDGVAIANHTAPQKALLMAHQDVITSTDMQLVYLAHLAKISNFMPQVASQFGNEFIHHIPNTLPRDVPKGEWRGDIYCHQDFELATSNRRHNRNTSPQTIEWDLDTFSYYDEVQNLIAQIICNAYINIDSLRHLMSPQTLEEARKSDLFSMSVIDGRLSQVEDIKLRIECCYFALHQQKLGIYPEAVPETLSNSFDESASPTEFIRGVTPESYINRSHAKPQPSQPRLVYQSPR